MKFHQWGLCGKWHLPYRKMACHHMAIATEMFHNRVVVLLVLTTLSGHGGAQLGTMPESFTSTEGVSEAYVQSDSGTTLYSAYNLLKCTSDVHLAPKSTEEVSHLVKELLVVSHNSTSQHSLKIRATRHDFHSFAGFVCAGNRFNTKREFTHPKINSHENVDNNKPPGSVTMLLHLMNRVISVDTELHQLTVEAGITLQTLVDAAQANRMSMTAGVSPAYGNLSLGGVISTSAHGSGLGVASIIGDLVTKLKWVNGWGEVIISDTATEQGAKEVAALVGGLGLLGILTEVTLQLRPLSYTIVETRNHLDDTNMVSELISMLRFENPNSMVQWKPEFKEYRAVLFKEVDSLPASGAPPFLPNAKSNIMHAADDEIAGVVKDVLAAWDADPDEESPVADVLNSGICSIGRNFFSGTFIRDEDGTLYDNATVYTNNAMLALECAPKCSTQTKRMGAITDDISYTIKISQLQDWVTDVRAIIDAELQQPQARLNARYGDGKVKRCTSPGLIWLRFGQKSKSLLSMNTGSEDVVYAQWSTMQSVMTPNRPSKHAAIIETIEQLNLCKYKARPHWGKNYERAFRHHKCHLRDNFPESNIAQLLELQKRHDPAKVFEPELFRHVMERSGSLYSNECSLTYGCYCEEDVHCAQGYVCRPSRPFPMYKICKRPEPVGRHSEL